MIASFSNSSYLIHHLLEHSADACPDKEAVLHGTKRYTYRTIEENANRIANWLLDYGLKPGERVALLLRNSVEYICAYYGILKSGCIVVPLNTGLDSRELTWMNNDCGASVLISEKFFSEIINSMHSIGSQQVQILAMIDSNDALKNTNGCVSLAEIYSQYSTDRPRTTLIDRELASIIYTSGSTGRPKGVMLSHLNVLTNTRSIVSYLELTSSDRCMVVLPFYYVYGKSLLNIHFAVSGSIIIDNRFTFPNVVLKTMIAERATGFAGVSSTYAILVNKSSICKMSFPDLRYITQAGGHMPSELKSRLLTIFPDKKIFIMYGATEASARLSYLPPEKLVQEIHSIGKAIPNVKIDILKEDGSEASKRQLLKRAKL
jgi:acyl-CoA synthetase (AMP-forming)/AMP-acid ligase II